MKNIAKTIALVALISVATSSCSWFKRDKRGDALNGSDTLTSQYGDGTGTGLNGAGVDGAGLDGLNGSTSGVNTAGQEELIAVAGDRVFFGTDSSSVSDEGASTLRKQASWLNQNPNVTVTVEGHCDERGTREYNIALGERRANAVKEFLVSQGVAGNRINVISYGKEFPEFLGSTESAWSKNRRGVTVVN